MRYFVILLVFAGFIGTAYAVPPQDSERLYDTSDVIIFGKIVFANSTFSPTNTLYHVEVEKFHKNPQDDDVIFVVGPNTENPRLGNQVFAVGDKALLFLINRTEYDPYYSVHYHSFLVKPEWEECDIFSIDFPREHWIFGGRGPDPKVHQENSKDNHNFKPGKVVTLTYDIFNITPNQQTVLVGLTIFNRDDPDSTYVFRNTSTHSVEPCVPYRTLDWSFIPSNPGRYGAEFDNLMGSRITIGFTVKGPQSDSSDDSTTQSALNPNDFASKLWHEHDIIIDGSIIEKTVGLGLGLNYTMPSYQIKVNEYFKGKHEFDLVYAISSDGLSGFEKGDRVLFYLKKGDELEYSVSQYSIKTTDECNARDFIEISPVLPNEKPPISMPVSNEAYVDPCVPPYFPEDPDHVKIGDEDKFEYPRPDEGIINRFSHPPLKQFKSGIPIDQIQCKEGLELILKSIDGSPACVKPETKQKLIERGWTNG